MTPPRKLIVTGASTGLGRALATLAAARGWEVLATARTASDRAALESRGLASATLDLRDDASIGRFADQAERWCGGRLHALANNAGVAFPGAVEDLRAEEVREQFEVNVFGHLQVTQALLPALRAAPGRILFVSSDRAGTAMPGYGAYIASKRALRGFAEVLAEELAPAGVAVTVFEPGAFESAIRGPIAGKLKEQARRTRHHGPLIRHLASRLGSPPVLDTDVAAQAAIELLEVDAPPLVSRFPSEG